MITSFIPFAAAGKRNVRRTFATAIGAMLLVSCGGGDGGTNPTGDVLVTVTLRAPEAATTTGAVRFRLTGPGISGVQAAFPGYTVYPRNISSSEVQVIVVGTLASGPLITAEGTGGDYDAEVLEIATTTNAVVDPPTGYSAVVGLAPLDD